ncbi:hypothetical protein ACO2I3_14640 [Leptospira interrogans]
MIAVFIAIWIATTEENRKFARPYSHAHGAGARPDKLNKLIDLAYTDGRALGKSNNVHGVQQLNRDDDAGEFQMEFPVGTVHGAHAGQRDDERVHKHGFSDQSNPCVHRPS